MKKRGARWVVQQSKAFLKDQNPFGVPPGDQSAWVGEAWEWGRLRGEGREKAAKEAGGAPGESGRKQIRKDLTFQLGRMGFGPKAVSFSWRSFSEGI